MPVAYQGSLLDDGSAPGFGPLTGRISRADLGSGAWIDVAPAWVTGADSLFLHLMREVPWQAERRRMYDREVEVPRLLSFYGEDDELPHPVLDRLRSALDHHYADELGERFATAGLCLYRDGHDSVAWHGDTIGRGSSEDTMVAIISVGSPRALMLRPREATEDGRQNVRRDLGHGDLVVMGGSCQRTWEHAVPKTARPAGPRISIQFRPRGVR